MELWLQRQEERAAYRRAHPPKPKTPAQRQREVTRSRLVKAQAKLERYIHELLVAHLDKSGWRYWNSLPLISDSEWHGDERRPGIAMTMAQIKADADAGCVLSAAFLEQWQEAYELCDYWRHQRPPRGPSAPPTAETYSTFAASSSESTPTTTNPALPDLDDVEEEFYRDAGKWP